MTEGKNIDLQTLSVITQIQTMIQQGQRGPFTCDMYPTFDPTILVAELNIWYGSPVFSVEYSMDSTGQYYVGPTFVVTFDPRTPERRMADLFGPDMAELFKKLMRKG